MLGEKQGGINVSKRYRVEITPDDHMALNNALHEIADSGERVINVIWQPHRKSEEGFDLRAAFVIVVEADVDR